MIPVQQAHVPFELLVEETAQWTKRPHQHNFFELVFIEEGEGRQCINHQQFAYQRHNIFLLPPLDCHSFDIATPTRFVFLRFTNQVFAPQQGGALDLKDWFQKLSYILLNYNRVPGDVVPSGRDKQHLLSAVQLIRDEHARPDSFSPTLIQTALVTILHLLTRNIETALLAGSTGTGTPSPRFLRVLNHIQHHLFDHAALRVPALAEQAGMSPSYFSEYFRTHAGESLQTYLTTSRLKPVCCIPTARPRKSPPNWASPTPATSRARSAKYTAARFRPSASAAPFTCSRAKRARCRRRPSANYPCLWVIGAMP